MLYKHVNQVHNACCASENDDQKLDIDEKVAMLLQKYNVNIDSDDVDEHTHPLWQESDSAYDLPTSKMQTCCSCLRNSFRAETFEEISRPDGSSRKPGSAVFEVDGTVARNSSVDL